MSSRARTSSPAAKKPQAPKPYVPYVPAPVVAPKASAASRLCSFLEVWWTLLFAAGVLSMQCFVEPKQGFAWPPKMDLSGKQAIRVLSSKWLWACWTPMLLGVFWLRHIFKTYKIKQVERGMMLWWLTNAFFFHLHCDILSGYFQVMPVLSDHYSEISPAHLKPRWADARLHLDSTYLLEGVAEIPLALITLFLYTRRHPARFFMEIFALAVQFAGTIIYYFPRFMKYEKPGSWLCYFDWSFGAVWVAFPLAVLVRHVCSAVRAAGADKKS